MNFLPDTAEYIRSLARIGRDALAAGPVGREITPPRIPTRLDHNGEDVDAPDDPAYLLACRAYDRDLILAARKSLTSRPTDPECALIAGLSIQWPRRMARLKTWGGQQNLCGLLSDRLDCLMLWAGGDKKRKRRKKGEPVEPPEPSESPEPELRAQSWKTTPAMNCVAALKGVSGIMPGHASVNAIDLGFSPEGRKFKLNPWLEILVLVGVEFAPIAIIPSGQFPAGLFAVYGGGAWHPFFRRERVSPYYFAWDTEHSTGLLPHQFAKLIDPTFQPRPFDDLQIPRHLLANDDLLQNEIARLRRIASRQSSEVLA